MAKLGKSALAMLECSGIEVFDSSEGDYSSFFLREWNGSEWFYKTSVGAVKSMLRRRSCTAMYGVRKDGSEVMIAAY